MKRLLLSMTLGALLAGCGLGETAVTAAAVGASQAKQAEEAKKTMARVNERLDAAAKAGAERRDAADAATQ